MVERRPDTTNVVGSIPTTRTKRVKQNMKNPSYLNSLRAAVLGANDGVVSVASIIFGVAGATNSITTILTAAVAGTVAGALSMATGEYVSVSTQRDTEKVMQKNELASPIAAAVASGSAFIAGAVIPLIFIAFSPSSYRIYFTFLSAIVALIFTGILSAHVGRTNKLKATIRVVSGGIFAMFATYLVGLLFGVYGI